MPAAPLALPLLLLLPSASRCPEVLLWGGLCEFVQYARIFHTVYFSSQMLPQPPSFVAVAAAALAQRLSATRAGGGLEHLFVQHGSGACAEGSHALRAHEWVLWPSLAAFVRKLLRPAADDGRRVTRASARGAFCSLAVLWDFFPAGVRSADER